MGSAVSDFEQTLKSLDESTARLKKVFAKAPEKRPNVAMPKKIVGRYVGTTLGCDATCGVLVMVLDKKPSKKDWSRYCEAVAYHATMPRFRGVAGWVKGVLEMPDSVQRDQVQETSENLIKVALFGLNKMVGNVLGCLNRHADAKKFLKFFPLSEQNEALVNFLEVPENELQAIEDMRKGLIAEIKELQKKAEEGE